jgi:Uma2 family endonuclease
MLMDDGDDGARQGAEVGRAHGSRARRSSRGRSAWRRSPRLPRRHRDAIKATTGTSPYYFSDLIMVCGPQEYEDVDGIDVLKNPCVVIEVLSRTTRKADESFKLESHLGLPSVKLVVLVDTDEVTAAMHARARDVQIEHRPTMRELAEVIARVVVELD